MKNALASLLIIVCFSACSHKEADQKNVILSAPIPAAEKEVVQYDAPVEKSVNDKVTVMAVALPNAAPVKPIDTAKKIVKTGDISFETGSMANARLKIIHSVEKAGGYIAEDVQSKDESSGRKQYMLSVRVPSKSFDKLMNTVSGTADKIDSKNIRVKDVTTEYIDIKSRLDNKRKLENSYLALLGKANRMADILQIEAKLTEIRSDIESTQGQLNYMDKQVAYSSLDITFYSKYVVPSNGDGFAYKFKSALSGGLDTLQNVFFGLINAWPMLAFAALVYLLFMKYVRRKKNLPVNA